MVSTIHSDYRLDYLNSIWKMYTFGLINTVSLRFLDYYVAVSNNFREMLIKRGFPPQRIYTVYNGIPFDKPVDIMPPEDFAKKYGFPIQPGDIFIGILARLDPVKGHTVFLDAAAKVAKKCPQARFLIGGPGDDLRPSLEKRASRLGISDKVFFLGKVTEPYSFFNLIDINVLASYSESFPYVILEGARMKKATVSSRVGGLEDLFVQGENGYLFTPGDSDALADYLIELICDEEKRRRFGENIYKSASERFSLKAMTETQLSIYSRIMKQVKKSKSDRKKYDIAILGYYGYRNSGDDAILKSIIGQLKQKTKNCPLWFCQTTPMKPALFTRSRPCIVLIRSASRPFYPKPGFSLPAAERLFRTVQAADRCGIIFSSCTLRKAKGPGPCCLQTGWGRSRVKATEKSQPGYLTGWMQSRCVIPTLTMN